MIVLEKRSSGRRHEKRRRTWINESWKGITQILPPNNSVNILTKRKRKARELSLTVTPPPRFHRRTNLVKGKREEFSWNFYVNFTRLAQNLPPNNSVRARKREKTLSFEAFIPQKN